MYYILHILCYTLYIILLYIIYSMWYIFDTKGQGARRDDGGTSPHLRGVVEGRVCLCVCVRISVWLGFRA